MKSKVVEIENGGWLNLAVWYIFLDRVKELI
jgi:hypothetical protein